MREKLLRWESVLLLLCIFVFVWGSASTPGFAETDNISFLLLDYTEVALLALALLPIILTGEIDLSVASILGFCSALTGVLWDAGMSFESIVPIVLVAGAVLGSLNATLIVRFALPALAVTIGTLGLYRGLAYVVLGDGAVTGFPDVYRPIATEEIPGTFLPYATLVVLLLGVLVAVVVHYTPVGRSLYAIGLGEQTARFSGIRVQRIKFVLYIVSGILCAIASLVYTLRYNSARADNANGMELIAVAAVLLGGVSIFGGRGTVVGVASALLLMAGLRNVLFLNDVTNEIQNVINGLLLIISVLVPVVANLVRRRRTPAAAAIPGSPPPQETLPDPVGATAAPHGTPEEDQR
ncbi:ATPase [Prauserella sp. PE36]|uniref:Autoinducer 2 import system permease protein LsrD n=1 Tax=Prauserella endophytica TaxID=1592324 RepID=A0ABY2RW86_9PSEU|nr:MULTISPECIES: ABC transporter permease [Prauserella]PXY34431.1 ATPase [Prauserella coralliicola]RBM20519.1 ATPase [Prauserella sp. PE36]TKG62895.1 ABC transporter permease [Prauserella endophytica]